MKAHRQPTLELTPLEAERLNKYINGHKGQYIELYYALGLGMGYTLEVSTNETEETLDITDYESF